MKRLFPILFLLSCVSAFAQDKVGLDKIVGKTFAFQPECVSASTKINCFFTPDEYFKLARKRRPFNADDSGFTPANEIIGHEFRAVKVIKERPSSKYKIAVLLLRDGCDSLYLTFSQFAQDKNFKADAASFSDQFIISKKLETSFVTDIQLSVLDLTRARLRMESFVDLLNKTNCEYAARHNYKWKEILEPGTVPSYKLTCTVSERDSTRKEETVFAYSEAIAASNRYWSSDIGHMQTSAQEFCDFLNQYNTCGKDPYRWEGLEIDNSFVVSAFFSNDEHLFSIPVNEFSARRTEISGFIDSCDSEIDNVVAEFRQKNYPNNPFAVSFEGRRMIDSWTPTYVFQTADNNISDKLSAHIGITDAYKITIVESKHLGLASGTHTALAGKDMWLNQNVFATPTRSKKDTSAIYDVMMIRQSDAGMITTSDIMYIGRSECSSNKYFWDGAIGGYESRFFNFHVEGLEKREPLIDDSMVREYRGHNEAMEHYKKRYRYGDETIYIKITPCKDKQYRVNNSSNDIVWGRDINAAIYIPFRETILKGFFTEEEMNSWGKDFEQYSQRAWNAYMDEAKEWHNTLEKVYGKEAADIIAGGNVRFGFTLEMCMAALRGEPYQLEYYVNTPLGKANKYNFYTQDIQLYFIDNILIGIAWRGNGLKYHM